MNKNAYIQLNLKKASRVTYANNSKRRNGPTYELTGTIGGDRDKNTKYNFIEMYGRGITLSPTLKKSYIFKNKDKDLNPLVEKEEKLALSKNPIKEGSIIDNWEVVIWCKEDFVDNDVDETGVFELTYFDELPDGATWRNYIPSNIYFEILLNKKEFIKIKKAILSGHKPKKNEDIDNNIFLDNNFIYNKFEIELDPEKKIESTMGYNVDTGKRISKSKETIIGYQFDILSFELI